jgi:Prolyl oligopeptidase family
MAFHQELRQALAVVLLGLFLVPIGYTPGSETFPASSGPVTRIGKILSVRRVLRPPNFGGRYISRWTIRAAPKAERGALPYDGAVFLRADPGVPGTLLYMTSWTKAFKVYAYDPKTNRVTDTGIQPAGPCDDPVNVESVEVRARSYDGTLVPLSIMYPKGMKLDGSNPTYYLSGYGAFGSSEDPGFDPIFLAWHQKGGVMAVCHVRGGGEYGEKWHLAGKGQNKPNTWRDFIACAQYLIDNKYTSLARLAGEGASGGGILIGRAITEQPGLFGAAIVDVGLEDALRAETTANGETCIPEFSSTKTAEGFAALYEMSAFHHVKRPHALSRCSAYDRHQRSARCPMDAGQDDRALAGGDFQRQTGFAEGRLWRRSFW